MKTIKVLLTSAGSQVAPGIINMIKQNRSYKVIAIGTDAGIREELVGRHFCDRFYTVPYAKDTDYVSTMLNICKNEKVSVIFPGSDEEALILSQKRRVFSSVDTKIACAEAFVIEKSLDKFELMKLLKENRMPVGQFYEPKKLGDIKRYCFRLGYPKDDVVIKPKVARGSRGFRIITDKKNLYSKFSKNEFYYITLKEVTNIFKDCVKELNHFFIMEYLPGPRYSVDILIERSKPVVGVCRKKIFPISSPTQLADIVYDKDIIEYAKSIASFLGFDYFVQVEIGRDIKGEPQLIEINPRIDATLPIVSGLRINYFEELIYYVLNSRFRKEDFKLKRKPIRFYRYWEHIFRKY
jgi:carbamoyl-phosphate synthase large subunit